MVNIYVGNLPYSTVEDELRELFAAFGEVETIYIIRCKHSGQSKGFGFVEMAEQTGASLAIKALNGLLVDERAIRVNEARSKGGRPDYGRSEKE